MLLQVSKHPTSNQTACNTVIVWQYRAKVELWLKCKKPLEDDTRVYKEQINGKNFVMLFQISNAYKDEIQNKWPS